MKTAKICVSLAMLMGAYGSVSAQLSPFVGAQVDAAAKPCLDLAGASAGLPDAQAKAVATAAIEPCYDAVKALNEFQKTNATGMTTDELNYLYYVGGKVIWITAASEVMKNDGQLNAFICNQVDAAERTWGNVTVPEGTQIDIEMRNNELRNMLAPACDSGP